jgi:hypothetical protein
MKRERDIFLEDVREDWKAAVLTDTRWASCYWLTWDGIFFFFLREKLKRLDNKRRRQNNRGRLGEKTKENWETREISFVCWKPRHRDETERLIKRRDSIKWKEWRKFAYVRRDESRYGDINKEQKRKGDSRWEEEKDN